MRTVRSSSRLPGGGVPGPWGVYLVPGGVPGLGSVPGPGGWCTWSRGLFLVPWGLPGPGGCTWSWGVYLVLGGVPGPRGCTWSQGGVPGVGGVPAQVPHLVDRRTCKNITFATSLRTVIINIHSVRLTTSNKIDRSSRVFVVFEHYY